MACNCNSQRAMLASRCTSSESFASNISVSSGSHPIVFGHFPRRKSVSKHVGIIDNEEDGFLDAILPRLKSNWKVGREKMSASEIAEVTSRLQKPTLSSKAKQEIKWDMSSANDHE